MAGLDSDADLAVMLHAADSGTVPGAWIEDDERPFPWIGLGSRWRNDPH